MRHTKLNFEDLLKKIKDPELGQHWKFFYLGGMRNLLLKGGSDAKKAESFFRELLDSDNPDERLIAFRCLMTLKPMSNETYRKLEIFKGEPSNREIIKQFEKLTI